ncbi:MAG: M48 family metallopeptidase [Flavobacteriales bacterium]|nr:M48 family metallopeptidase [Flavobacteriales bacterium]
MSQGEILYIAILSIVICSFLFEQLLSFLNKSWFGKRIHPELEGIYSQSEYDKSQNYKKVNFKVSLFSSALNLILLLIVLQGQIFGKVDSWVSEFTDSKHLKSIFFFAIVFGASSLLNLPISLYKTFVIEKKFGFNKMTIKTFVLDGIKSLLLTAILGSSLLFLMSFLWHKYSDLFGLYAWTIITLIMILITAFYTNLIVPIFNKLTPLEDGELKDEILKYSKSVEFPLENIYVINGSLRSTRANAYFSGLGKSKKIVLYDTLIEKHSIEELIAIIAHEVGHYKEKHTLKGLITGIIQMGIMCFLFGYISNSNGIAEAFGAEKNNFHLSLIAFSILFSPISIITGVLFNYFSRKNEYEADDYAKRTYQAKHLITALKTLSKDNLSNLTPHPSFVFVHYSHPPLRDRLKNLSNPKA